MEDFIVEEKIKLMEEFADIDSTVWFVEYKNHVTTVTIYSTSWWRELLFWLGKNVYYKKTILRVMGNPFNL